MVQTGIRNSHGITRRVISALLIVVFSFGTVIPPYVAEAQGIPMLPSPGAMVVQSSGYVPALIRGIVVHPDNPLAFDFIIDTGDSGIAIESDEFKMESIRLIKYFLASLTVPAHEMWVNLSPYESGRVIPESFGQTEMGIDLLAQDYILKQLTASLMYPEEGIGQAFWKRVHDRARKEFGTTDIPMDSFHKVWIVPEEAFVYEKDNTAFVVRSRLKVMMEEDYFAMRQNQGQPTSDKLHMTSNGSLVTRDASRVTESSRMTDLQTEVMREIILPEIEKEVNEGENFANLRQIYQGMILATWFKRALKESLLGHVYVDRNKIRGVDAQDPSEREKIYQQYVEAFERGVYDYIKEEYDPQTREIVPRQYFSGGFQGAAIEEATQIVRHEEATPEQQHEVQQFRPVGTLGLAESNLAEDGRGSLGVEGDQFESPAEDVEPGDPAMLTASERAAITQMRADFVNRYQNEFIAAINRAETMLNDDGLFAQLNWANLIKDLVDGAADAERLAQAEAEARGLIEEVRSRIRDGVSLFDQQKEWLVAKNNGDALAKIKLTHFADNLMSSFSQFQTLDEAGNIIGIDLLRGLAQGDLSVRALQPTEIFTGVPQEALDARQELLERRILEAQYVGQMIFAGAATRLGLGSMYGLSVRDVLEKRLEQIAAQVNKAGRAASVSLIQEAQKLEEVLANPEYAELINIGLGPRQIMAYVARIKDIARKYGEDAVDVMRRQKIIINVNGAAEADVLSDLLANDFYGFERENVMLLVQDVYTEYVFNDEGGFVEVEGGELYPYGHGYTTEQLAVPGIAFILNAEGNKEHIEQSVLNAVLEGFGASQKVLIGQHRVNDMARSTGAVLQSNFLGYAFQEIEAGNTAMIVKLVDNPSRQKGGTGVDIYDARTGKVLLSALVETLESKALTVLDNVLAGGHPYNTMRTIRDARVLREIARDGLPMYHEFKKLGMKGEMVSGDETKHPMAKTTLIVEGTEKIYDFKTMGNIPVMVEFMAQQIREAEAALSQMIAEHSSNRTERPQVLLEDLLDPQARSAEAGVGGIDLNPELLDLKIRRDGNGIPLPMDQQLIESLMLIEGFLPVIINVTPVFNLPMLLGMVDPLDDGSPDQRLSRLDAMDKAVRLDY